MFDTKATARAVLTDFASVKHDLVSTRKNDVLDTCEEIGHLWKTEVFTSSMMQNLIQFFEHLLDEGMPFLAMQVLFASKVSTDIVQQNMESSNKVGMFDTLAKIAEECDKCRNDWDESYAAAVERDPV